MPTKEQLEARAAGGDEEAKAALAALENPDDEPNAPDTEATDAAGDETPGETDTPPETVASPESDEGTTGNGEDDDNGQPQTEEPETEEEETEDVVPDIAARATPGVGAPSKRGRVSVGAPSKR